MARKIGTLSLSSNIEAMMGAPLDARAVVATLADLTAVGSFPYSYLGMLVVVQETSTLHILKGADTTISANWAEISGASGDLDNYYTKSEVDRIISTVYKPAGACAFAGLPDLAEETGDNLGKVYSITEEFTTTADFIEGAGKTYPLGSNVVLVNIGTTDTPVYKYDVLPGFIDQSALQTKMQVTELPTALEGEEGKIYQYIGVSTSTLVNGYFYQCVEVEGTDPTEYEWVQKNVQDTSDLGVLGDSLTASVSVGGIDSGRTFPAGTPFETLWRNLISPTLYPSFTNPSFTISTVTPLLQEAGSTVNVTLNTSFNRGSIVPAYGTDGYRSGNGGAVDDSDLIVGDGTFNVSGSNFVATASATNDRFQGRAHYEAGTQPKDSDGNDYDTPLAAGTVNSNVIVFQFVDALWANTANIATIAKLDLVSKSAGIKEFAFPAATVANPETFDVPQSWNVTAVEVLNTLSNTWEDCSAEFTTTTTTHQNAASEDVNYVRYTCNLGYAMADRRVRIKFN